MERKKHMAILLIVLLLGFAIYFLAFYESCNPVSPPKTGQIYPTIVEKDGQLYQCRSYFQRISGK